jgi:hypothetical protein
MPNLKKQQIIPKIAKLSMYRIFSKITPASNITPVSKITPVWRTIGRFPK